MDERIIDTDFEKFLNRFRKSLTKIIEAHPLNRILIVIENNFVKLYILESFEKASLKRVFRSNHAARLVSHFVANGVTEPIEDDIPYNFTIKNGSCVYVVTSKELNKI